ncbi:MAG: 16S rRNA (cytidine(1402)-2'-O)-methyltransferase [Verrucomicrobiota bacterium]|nr:16S rRNA (cytidine(1402)-2'-O)-methyltransferase [Verrucomicrobiota bacterium]
MLSIVATPIGNLGDMSPRGVDALRAADVIACEDTRRTRILLSRFQAPAPAVFLSYREGNEERVGERLLEFLRAGKKVALCSDSGCPGISDPGYRLVRLAVARGEPLEVIPGPSAVHVALLLSGLPTSSYTFKGYPPRKPGPRRRFLEEEKEAAHTLVLFESPFRVENTLQAAFAVLGDRPAAVCVELTKKFERVSRGLLSALTAEYAGARIKGEVTIVIAGNKPKLIPAHLDETV